ncbi:MAG: RecA/RadA recombinase [Myxococcaceae bacterium]|nr:RecA/RadA recombinase [Myxococcaceae bacterium]
MAKYAVIPSSVSSLAKSASSASSLAKCLPQAERGGAVIGTAPLWSHFRAGQLLELSGSSPGKLSTVARLIVRAQSEGEPVVWVAAREEAGFYPPDFALAGIDLAALVVVRVPHEQGPHALVRASEVLLRSGAFGLLVLDFAATAIPRGELAWQARLSGLVRRHEARVVILTASRREDASLGPLIGLRIEPHAESQVGRESARVLLTQRVLKSKLGANTSLSPDVRTLPLGARAESPEKSA